MDEARERGHVLSWNKEKGHGKITASNGDVLFCHFSFIDLPGYRALAQGQLVEYQRVVAPGPAGTQLQAWHVSLVH